jgi:hypothetical protein
MEKTKFLYKPISQTDILKDHQLEAIEAGGCESCSKSCQPGKQNNVEVKALV